jgi:hypothetical protein
MRYFVAFLMLVSIGMFAMGCSSEEKKPKDTKKTTVENGDNGKTPAPEPEPEPTP